jgi:CBS-domain-containing membrane protein
MRETHDGSIPVVDGTGRLIGIVTQSDITVKLVAMGASIPHAQVSDCMTGEAFACSADCTLEGCLSAMSWHQVTRIPIVDDEHRIIGTVSRSDLASYVCEHPHGFEHGAITDVLWAFAY